MLPQRRAPRPEATSLRPRNPDAAFEAALTLHRAGDLKRASALYRKVLRTRPGHGPALHLLGLAAQEQGRPAYATQLIAKAVAAEPRNALYRRSLAICLRAQGLVGEAAAAWREALRVDPASADAWTGLGNALKAKGAFAEAVDCHRKALELAPGSPAVLSNLGLAYREWGRMDDALSALREAVELAPDEPELRFNLGNAWLAAGRLGEAEQAFGETLARDPAHARALANLGVCRREQGDADGAIANLRRALALSPDWAEAHWNLGLGLLMAGRWAEGWREYEWRRRIPGFAMRKVEGPSWDGGPLAGRTVLLHAEQGLGDAIQFVRYARLARARGGTVILESPPALVPLFAGAGLCDRLLPAGEPRPAFDLQAPLMSLPGVLDPELAAASRFVPYLAADPERIARWRPRLAGLDGLKVGICWQGNPAYRADRARSIPLSCFSLLARIPGVRLVSLQKGPGEDQLAADAESGILRLCPELDAEGGAFIDSAAVIAGLDVVISSDTAIAHLAGALGREVWLALAHVPDWRWGTSGTQSPWYPAMRLFRQTQAYDWDGVFAGITAALAARAAGGD